MQGSLRGDQIRDITHWNATRREASASMLKGTENLGEIEGMGNAPVVFHKLERDYQVHYFIYKVTLVLIVCLEGIKLPGRLGHLPDNDDEAQPLSPTTINRGRSRALAFRTLRDQKFRIMTRNFVCEIFNGSDGLGHRTCYLWSAFRVDYRVAAEYRLQRTLGPENHIKKPHSQDSSNNTSTPPFAQIERVA